MRNPTPAPIIVPATGAPTCRGVALRLVNLGLYESDAHQHLDLDQLIRICADRAIRDGHVLCLRPTADRPACVGLSPTQFAVASLQADFATRALVVDPYDADGNDIREGTIATHDPLPPWPRVEDHEAHLADAWAAQVAVWEGSEAT